MFALSSTTCSVPRRLVVNVCLLVEHVGRRTDWLQVLIGAPIKSVTDVDRTGFLHRSGQAVGQIDGEFERNQVLETPLAPAPVLLVQGTNFVMSRLRAITVATFPLTAASK